MTRKLITTTAIFTAAATVSLLAASTAFAAGASGVPCVEVYGGNCQPGTITINKTVEDPQTKQFVDNLGAADNKYAPNNQVTFHIDVTNTGGTDLKDVKVIDTLPQYVTFASGVGNFDANTKTLTETINDLPAGQTKELTVVATIASSNNLPADQGTICLVNQAEASQNGNTVMDTAQFCVAKPVVYKPQPVKKTPPTGPEDLALLGLIPTAFAGLKLRKAAN